MIDHRRDWTGQPIERWLSLSESLSWIAWKEIVRVEDLLTYAASRSVSSDQIASDLQESWTKLRDELSVRNIDARAAGSRAWLEGEYAIDVDRARNAPKLFWDPIGAVLEARTPEPPPRERDDFWPENDEPTPWGDDFHTIRGMVVQRDQLLAVFRPPTGRLASAHVKESATYFLIDKMRTSERKAFTKRQGIEWVRERFEIGETAAQKAWSAALIVVPDFTGPGRPKNALK